MAIRTPITLRVKVAFGFYSVGHVFLSPPMPGVLRDDLLGKGYLEIVPEVAVRPKPKPPVERKTRAR